MADDNRARFKQWLASGEARLQPLTFPQRELWECSPVAVADPSNHICSILRIKGAISPQDCEMAIQRVVDRQEVLRTTFLPGKTQPLQMIRATGTANFRTRDLEPSQWEPAAMEAVLQEIFTESFDMARGPLYRVEMLRRAPDDIVLVLAIHHAIADGWTLGIFVQDLCAAYLQNRLGTGAPLAPLPLNYAQWGADERTLWTPAKLAAQGGFWKAQLAGSTIGPISPISPIGPIGPIGPINPIGPPPLARWITMVPEDLASAVRALARRSGATLFNTLLTAFHLALSRWAGAGDIVVGTPVANRNRPAVRETMGYFADNIPLRNCLDPAAPFSVSVRQVHQSTVESFANAMPFAELVRALDHPPSADGHRIYDVRFALQNHPIPDVDLPGLSIKLTMRSTGTARFDLGCEVTEMGGGLEVVWLFKQNRFARKEMEELNHLFCTVLTEASRASECHASER